MKTSVDNCARCGGRHDDLTVKAFTRPPKRPHGYWWFTTCPETDEPLLLRLVTEIAKPDAPAGAPSDETPTDPLSDGSERMKGS